jgi:uncharacterized protein
MRLYAGMSRDFIQDTVHNQIAGKLTDAFFRHFRYKPSPTEITSWRNSLRAVSQVFHEGQLEDHGVILEYQLPLTSKRLDCLICGRDGDSSDRAVIIELKQWERCAGAIGEDLVTTWVGGAEREILHPSAQVRQYQWYLQDNHTAFHEGPEPIKVNSCAYLHNYYPEADDVVFSQPFHEILTDFPTFAADHVPNLTSYLRERLSAGGGRAVLKRIEESRYRPSKKLMDHVGNVIKGKKEYVLLDEQLVVYEKVLSYAREGFRNRRKAVLIVKGGPGTGKSVIAINLMADLLLGGHNAQYATGSRAFTGTLRRIIGPRGAIQFKFFNGYVDAQPNEVDVLVCDEAHRIRMTSDNRFTPKRNRGGERQIDELLSAAKVLVFLIDDKQIVRPDEIGSSEYIREHAEASGCQVSGYQLEAQFRCAGSDGFINWINNTLGIERTANVLWEGDENFDFRIFESPDSLEQAIRSKAAEGFSARVMAGFCWPWSLPRSDGTLVDDIEIGNYRRPWDAKPEAKRLAKGIPKAIHWAHDPNGINQVGCVYTAQGFEFDYAGVIFGTDLTYSFEHQAWVGHPDRSSDRAVKRGKERFSDLVKNVYRVLLSRGLKGCYVYFMDKETERFFRSRMEVAIERLPAELSPAQLGTSATEFSVPATCEPFRRLPIEEVRPFVNSVPLYDLSAAAGRFSDVQEVEEVAQGAEVLRPEEFQWVELPDEFRPRRGLFVAKVVGESMNRRIPNGAWCLFRLSPQASRQGKIVLVQLHGLEDPETGGQYTVKLYESEKRIAPDGEWRHAVIVLRPDSTSSAFEPIALESREADDLRVIAELVAVLG